MSDAVSMDLADRLEAACHEPLRAVWAALVDPTSSTLLETVRTAVDRHRSAMEAAGLAEAPPTEWEVRSERLLQYRRAISSELLEPLARAFDRGAPSTTVLRRVVAGVERSLALCDQLPEKAGAPWRAGALAPLPVDAWGRRAGKLLARLAGSPAPGEEREVPLRALAMRHLHRVVVPANDRLALGTMRGWAGWCGRLEAAWVAWGDAALTPLVQAEVPGDEGHEGLWAAVRAAAEGLQSTLEDLASASPVPAHVAEVERAFVSSARALEADLDVSGSFLLRPTDNGVIPRLVKSTRAAPVLQTWDSEVADRLRLYISLLSILSGTTAVQRRLLWRFRDKCMTSVREISPLATALEAAGAAFAAEGLNANKLRRRLEPLAERVAALMDLMIASVPDEALVNSVIRDGADSTIEALLAMVRQAPDKLQLHSETASVPTGNWGEPRPIALQDLARQSFDAMRIERIRSSMTGLIEAVDAMRRNMGELPDVFRFAYDEAIRELDEAGRDAGERAQSLVADAVRSITESMRYEIEELQAEMEQAHAGLAREVQDGSVGLLSRVAAGRVEAQLLAARSRFANLRADVNEALGPHVDRAVRRIAVMGRRGRRVLSRNLAKARSMFGAAPTAQAASTRTIRTLTVSTESDERVPLVYQRLFTLDPITDATLLAGRTSELSDALSRWRRWQAEDGVPLIVRARQGSGITSFLNVLGRKIEEEGSTVVRLTLQERISDDGGLATALASVLGLAPCDSLDDLATAVFSAAPGTLPQAAALDNLEHLYTRVARGAKLIERLLTLMAETEPRVFWMAGITTSAWQLINATEATAISQVDVLDLPPLPVESVRDAVTARHRRSGLPVRFEEPATARRMLRRRLRRSAGHAAHLEALAKDFFDQLHRTSSGHLRLALFQWMASADFETADGVVMRPPQRPDFSVLDTLDLTQNFTLKAFLEHRTLTLAEHDHVFRLPRRQSFQIFESLDNRHLIEAVVGGKGKQRQHSEIEEGLRYRIRPLLIGAVIAHLQSRNIVH